MERMKSLGWQLSDMEQARRITMEEIEQRVKEIEQSRVVIGNQCQIADCDCHVMVGTDNVPPFHDGCDCVMRAG